MFTTTYTDVFSGNLITPAFPQYEAITLTSSIVLSWPAQFQNANLVVARIMVISPSAGGFTVTMPDARQSGTGAAFTINNPTAFSFNLLDNTGGVIVTVTGPSVSDFWLDNNTTQAGTWTRVPTGGGYTAVTSVNATSSSSNLVIGGVPITTIGTITFTLANDLLALTSFGASTGIATRTAANTWSLASIVGTVNQVIITNGSGVAGNPTIALAPNITGIASLAVGNLSLSLNSIISTNLNGPINLNPNGTGIINLNSEVDILAGSPLKFFATAGGGYISFRLGTTAVTQDLNWPTVAALPGQVLLNNGLGSLQWASVAAFVGVSTENALARYSNVIGGLKDSSVILDNAMNATGFNSCVIGNISIGLISQQTISTMIADQDLIIAPNGVGGVTVNGDLSVNMSSGLQRKLRLYATTGFYSALRSNNTIGANVTWGLPSADGPGIFTSDGAGNLYIIQYLPPASTVNAVARYSTTTGVLKDSIFLVSDTGAGTGLASCIIGNINIAVSNANVISSVPNTDITLFAQGTGTLSNIGNMVIFPKAGVVPSLTFYNADGSFSTSIGIQGTQAINNKWTLPAVDRNGLMSSNGTGTLTLNTGIIAQGPPNYNIGIGTSIFDPTSTNSVTFINGTLAAGAPDSSVVFQSQAISPANSSIAWYGSGNGGVTDSLVNTVTNLVAVTINGVIYYLLARNAP